MLAHCINNNPIPNAILFVRLILSRSPKLFYEKCRYILTLMLTITITLVGEIIFTHRIVPIYGMVGCPG